MDFKVLKEAVREQFSLMSSSKRLFVTNATKDELWETYLKSFPEGTNPIYKERREHDCQCCKQFIRACGNVVSIDKDLNLQSIWDIEIGDYYQEVADALSALVKSKVINQEFFHYEKNLGTDKNVQLIEEGIDEWEDKQTITWQHFHFKLPNKFVKNKDAMGTILGKASSNQQVFERGLKEITLEAIETVLDLIKQKSIYRGEEFKSAVESFFIQKMEYIEVIGSTRRNLYCWKKADNPPNNAPIRNTVIGTLLCDISDEVSLDAAVGKYEAKVAPTNYKRPTALITKGMIAKAHKKVVELGIADCLERRYSVTEDVTINNVLFADRSVKKVMNVFDELQKKTSDVPKNLDKVVAVDIKTFIDDILPRVSTIELLFENKHTNNLMSLISPINFINVNAKNLFKWDNNFSWGYNGNVTDSMKQRVKKAGGNVEGVLRFSIQWNDGDNNQNDFDAHCIEPNGHRIYYRNKHSLHSGGRLDVDIISPGRKVAVENITWAIKRNMLPGTYQFLVHNYNHSGGKTGFSAEIEYDGKIYSYEYGKELRQDQKVLVAELDFSIEKGIKFIKSLPSTHATKEVWNINTEKFQNVSMVMNSPNHWDGNKTGNKHYFFILEGCRNTEQTRGFYNEFLKDDLREHRKVFEVLGDQMKVEQSNNQLSGLGFSSTQKNQIVCRLTGTFNRIIKIDF